MLKFLFWSLLLANAALAAYQLGYLDQVLQNGHEPTRLDQQLNPERIRLIPAPPPEGVESEPAPPVSDASGTSGEAAATVSAVTAAAAECVEIGNFNPDEARLFLARLGVLGERAKARPIQEVASHMVYMPPQPDREGAEKKAAELRRLGVEDFFIIQDNSSLRWGISLGVFKTEESARTHLARLSQKGVRSARIGQRTVAFSQTAFQFRALDAADKDALTRTRPGFARQEIRECGAAA